MSEDSIEQKNKLEQQCVAQKKCYGIFGQIELATGCYLILIEKASLMGELLQSDSAILRVEKLTYININNAKDNAEPAEADKKFIAMIENI